MQLAGRIVPKAGNDTDRLHRCKTAHQTDHRSKHTNFGATVAIIWIVGIANEAPVAGLPVFPAAIRANLAMKLAYC